VNTIIFLDSGPLGLVTNPKAGEETKACATWLLSCLQAGAKVCLPEICDYEVRRELLRANKTKGLERLDQFKTQIDYVSLTTDMMLKAAELWAQARNNGKPTAAPEALDGDVILAAQAVLSAIPGRSLCIATTNVGHLSQFADARHWQDIQPEK